MANRTTEALVKGIIDVAPGKDIEPFITSANELVTELLTKPAYGFNFLRLELIERWLAAHFYTVFDPRHVEDQAGTVRQVLQGKIDLHLNSSIYGQQALMLDTSGALALLNNSAEEFVKIPPALYTNLPGITWLGTE